MKCRYCGFDGLRPRMDECPDCNAPVYKHDRVAQGKPDMESRHHADLMRIALYEQRVYKLTPRHLDESEQEFIERINREKTPLIVEKQETQFHRQRN